MECRCERIKHVAIGLIFEAGTHVEIRRSPDCPVHQCEACEGRGYVPEEFRSSVPQPTECAVCQGTGVKDA